MKLSTLLEAPLSDYQTFNVERLKKKQAREVFPTQSFKIALEKKLSGVNVKLYVYVAPIDKERHRAYDDRTDTKKADGSHLNPDYYFEVDKRDLDDLYPQEIVDKVKTGDDAITVILIDQASFKPTVWGLVHDIVHALTMSDREATSLHDEVDKLLNAELKASLHNKLINPKFENVDAAYLKPCTGTMRSASDEVKKVKRGRAFDVREEEFVTELFTQWLTTGKVKLTAEHVAAAEHRAELQDNLDSLVPKVEAIFKKLLDRAKGRIFLTSG